MGRCRSADRLLLDLRDGPVECLPLDRSASGSFKAGDTPATGREFTHKTLQLNFWRPGDEYGIFEDQIYIGAPDDKVAKSADPDNPVPPAAGKEAPSPKERNWDKIIDYRWVFR